MASTHEPVRLQAGPMSQLRSVHSREERQREVGCRGVLKWAKRGVRSGPVPADFAQLKGKYASGQFL